MTLPKLIQKFNIIPVGDAQGKRRREKSQKSDSELRDFKNISTSNTPCEAVCTATI